METNMELTEREQQFESLNKSQFNRNATTDSIVYSSQNYDMSNEPRNSNFDSSGYGSDSAMVYKRPHTPLGISDSMNPSSWKDIYLTFTDLNELEVLAIMLFKKKFKVRVSVNWNDEITHLVVKLNEERTYTRTEKCMNAILSHCLIINMDWIIQSIKKKCIQPEDVYMPLDRANEAVALLSWRIGRGISESTMLWAEKCVLYFDFSVKTSENYTMLKNAAIKVGFKVVERLKELNSVESNLRIALACVRIPDEGTNKAALLKLTKRLKSYKALLIHFIWFLEVMYRYRFITIQPYHRIKKYILQ